jgi:hypothetical protein
VSSQTYNAFFRTKMHRKSSFKCPVKFSGDKIQAFTYYPWPVF